MKFKNPLAVLVVTLAFALVLTGFLGSKHGAEKICDDGVIAQIEKGKTTKKEVKKLIGEPAHISFLQNDEEHWIYSYTESKTKLSSFVPKVGGLLGGSDTKTCSLNVIFSKNGKVKKVGKGETSGSTGLIQ